MHQPAITPPKLKIVVLLDSSTVPAWVHRALTDVETSEFAETVLWILGTRRRGNRAVFRDLWRSLSAGLFTLYRWLDRAMYKHAHDAFAPVSVLENPQGKEILRAVLTGDGASDRFEPEDLHRIRTCDPDVILQFGFDDLKGDILQVARFGVWAVSPGHSPNHVVSPAMFWDIYFKRTLSETGLYVMAESREDRRVLYQSIAHVNLNSLYRSSNPIYWKGSQFVGRRLRDLWQHGWQTVPGCKRPDGTAVFRTDRAPGNARMVRFMGRLALRFLRNKYMARCYYDQWHVALRKRRSFSSEGLDGAGFELLKSPPHSFFADPILITRGTHTFLFVEEFDWKTRKGVISCCELAPGGRPMRPKRVLEREYHLSYPFVFEHEGGFFMIPETASNRTIELYRAVDFPGTWELERVLFEGVLAKDATVFFYQGKTWLFAAMSLPGGYPNDELFLFFADSIHGSWTPHPMNPIVSDVRRARPAGGLFFENDELIRPSQDCSRFYGSAIVFNKIRTLTETEYEEFEIGRVPPDWLPGVMGTHTYDRTAEFEVVDVRRPLSRLGGRDS